MLPQRQVDCWAALFLFPDRDRGVIVRAVCDTAVCSRCLGLSNSGVGEMLADSTKSILFLHSSWLPLVCSLLRAMSRSSMSSWCRATVALVPALPAATALTRDCRPVAAKLILSLSIISNLLSHWAVVGGGFTVATKDNILQARCSPPDMRSFIRSSATRRCGRRRDDSPLLGPRAGPVGAEMSIWRPACIGLFSLFRPDHSARAPGEGYVGRGALS